jgi:endonuclease-3
MKRIIKDSEALSPSFLPKMKTDDAERYLVSLAGVGKKNARCILMYSFNREVFPLDTHCARILKHLGFAIPHGSLRKCEYQIQRLIPAPLRYSLHVTMVSLGTETCTSRAPKCDSRPLRRNCPTGVARVEEVLVGSTSMSPAGLPKILGYRQFVSS